MLTCSINISFIQENPFKILDALGLSTDTLSYACVDESTHANNIFLQSVFIRRNDFFSIKKETKTS